MDSDGLVWTVGLTVEIELRFQIFLRRIVDAAVCLMCVGLYFYRRSKSSVTGSASSSISRESA